MGTDENTSDQDGTDRPGGSGAETGAERDTGGQPAESGMDTGSDDQPRGEPVDTGGAATSSGPAPNPTELDRDSLAILAELATPGPRERRAAAEDSAEAADAVAEDAPTEAYRPEHGPDHRH